MTPPAPLPTPPQRQGPVLRMVDSQTLLNGDTVLLIRHLGEIYRLQTTRQGKLILTK